MTLFYITEEVYNCRCEKCGPDEESTFEELPFDDATWPKQMLDKYGSRVTARKATELEEKAYWAGSYDANKKGYRDAFNEGMISERRRINALQVGYVLVKADQMPAEKEKK